MADSLLQIVLPHATKMDDLAKLREQSQIRKMIKYKILGWAKLFKKKIGSVWDHTILPISLVILKS